LNSDDICFIIFFCGAKEDGKVSLGLEAALVEVKNKVTAAIAEDQVIDKQKTLIVN
jgi:hypothetical protein